MTKVAISSTSNPLLKRYRKLKSGAKRSRERATVVEGIAPVWQAVENADVETVFVSRDLLQSEAGHKLVDRARASGAEIVELTGDAFGSIADRDNPAGLAAIVARPEPSLDDLVVETDSMFVVLADVASPGNLGTIVRTADAARAAVIVTGESTDPWHPAAVKASMGQSIDKSR